MTWVRHYASHYYGFWALMGGLHLAVLVWLACELRAIRKRLKL